MEKKPKYTAWDFAQELSSYVPIPPRVTVISTDNTLNNKVTAHRRYKDLLKSWKKGLYDEDIDLAMDELAYVVQDVLTDYKNKKIDKIIKITEII